MKDFIDKLDSIPLSNQDLLNIAKCLGKDLLTIRIRTYDELKNLNVNHINELFPYPVNSIYILLQTKDQNIGHWVLLMKNQNGIIYFDPYSFSLIESLEITKNDDFLYQLLVESQVDENEYKLQEIKQGISTCGRHVCVRSIFPVLSNKEYYEKVILPPIINKQVADSDVLINLLTAFLSDSDKIVKEFYNCVDCADKKILEEEFDKNYIESFDQNLSTDIPDIVDIKSYLSKNRKDIESTDIKNIGTGIERIYYI